MQKNRHLFVLLALFIFYAVFMDKTTYFCYSSIRNYHVKQCKENTI